MQMSLGFQNKSLHVSFAMRVSNEFVNKQARKLLRQHTTPMTMLRLFCSIFLRGTGIHGLAGIPIRREIGCIIRPLLFATRKEIEMYAMENGIKYRNDSSNMSLAYRRNLLRHSILPYLVKRVPHIVKTLNSVADTMRDVSEKLHAIVKEALPSLVHNDSQDRLILDVKKLEMEPDFCGMKYL